MQATRPDTLAAALNDSPAGLLAWLAEKLVEWSDTPPGDPAAVERRISRERILTEAMIYWVTQSIASSFRPYYEGADTPGPIPPVEVPAAVLHPAARARLPRVGRAAGSTAICACSSASTRAGTSPSPRCREAMAARTRAFARELGLL